MGRGGGGKGGGKGARGGGTWLSSFFGRFIFGSYMDPYARAFLEELAKVRGFNNVDELLVSLGRHGSDISMIEAGDMLFDQVGYTRTTEIYDTVYYSRPKNCKRLKERIMELTGSGEEEVVLKGLCRLMEKYCGQKIDYKEN